MASGKYNNSNYELFIDAWAEGKFSWGHRVRFNVFTRKHSGTGYWSNNDGNNKWERSVHGQGNSASGFGFDFRGSTPKDIGWEGGTVDVYHTGDVTIGFSASSSLASIGSAWAGGNLYLPTVASVPDPPINPRWRDSATSYKNLGFEYTRGNDNGSGIQQDQIEWQEWRDGTGWVTVWNDMGPAGYSSPNGGATPNSFVPKPWTEYRVRGRSRNGVGWGPWSGYYGTGRTRTYAYFGASGAFQDAKAFVGKGDVFVESNILIGVANQFERIA